jgi:hypothetical protein
MYNVCCTVLGMLAGCPGPMRLHRAQLEHLIGQFLLGMASRCRFGTTCPVGNNQVKREPPQRPGPHFYYGPCFYLLCKHEATDPLVFCEHISISMASTSSSSHPRIRACLPLFGPTPQRARPLPVDAEIIVAAEMNQEPQMRMQGLVGKHGGLERDSTSHWSRYSVPTRVYARTDCAAILTNSIAPLHPASNHPRLQGLQRSTNDGRQEFNVSEICALPPLSTGTWIHSVRQSTLPAEL